MTALDTFLADYNAMRQRAETAEARVADLTEALARNAPSAVAAERDALAASLRALVSRLERVGGWTTHEDQAALRAAKAILVSLEGR